MDNKWYYTEWAKKYREVSQDSADEFGTWAAQNAGDDPEWLVWEKYQNVVWQRLYGGRTMY